MVTGSSVVASTTILLVNFYASWVFTNQTSYCFDFWRWLLYPSNAKVFDLASVFAGSAKSAMLLCHQVHSSASFAIFENLGPIYFCLVN